MFLPGKNYNISRIHGDNEGEYTYIGRTDMFLDKICYPNGFCETIEKCPSFYTKNDLDNISHKGNCHVFAVDIESDSITSVVISEKDLHRYIISEVVEYNYPVITQQEFLCEWEHDLALRENMLQHYRNESKRYNELDKIKGSHGSVKSSIKIGAFTGKISGDVINKNIDLKLISLWYDIALKISETLWIEGEYWCFYRSIKDYKVLNDFVQPLPTSYTTSIEFALSWQPSLVQCCILKVLVPMGTPLTFLDHNDFDSQSEVVVPAGYVRVKSRNKMDGKLVISCSFEPWPKEVCIDYVIKNLEL